MKKRNMLILTTCLFLMGVFIGFQLGIRINYAPSKDKSNNHSNIESSAEMEKKVSFDSSKLGGKAELVAPKTIAGEALKGSIPLKPPPKLYSITNFEATWVAASRGLTALDGMMWLPV